MGNFPFPLDLPNFGTLSGQDVRVLVLGLDDAEKVRMKFVTTVLICAHPLQTTMLHRLDVRNSF